MVILTLNCGSSSVKYQVYDWAASNVLASGIVERVGQEGSVINHKAPAVCDVSIEHECPNHIVAVELILKTITHNNYGVVKNIGEIAVVGHRMVHGGMKFARSVLINDESLATFKELVDLAPLHNPANITGVEAAKAVLPNVPHCAIMDTAWHQTMPDTSYLYALPNDWYEKHQVRRYGFHGTSFLYTAKRASVLLGKNPFESNIIIAHIGNGSSINAVKNGCSYDTSMGMTPLEGLVMGTRSGDMDPGIIFHVMRKTGMSAAEVEKKAQQGIWSTWDQRTLVRSERHRKCGRKRSQKRHYCPGTGIISHKEVYRSLLGSFGKGGCPSIYSRSWRNGPEHQEPFHFGAGKYRN